MEKRIVFLYAGEIRTIPVQMGGITWEPEIPQTGVMIDALEKIEKIEDVEWKELKYFCYVTRTQMFIPASNEENSHACMDI